jgi:hypothetical protein
MNRDLFQARQYVAHAMLLEREFHLLKEAGYFDGAGRPRKDAEGKRIWEFVQAQMKALPPFTDAEIDAELWKGEPR